MQSISAVYKIYNLNNGKCYIGSTCDLERRKKQHIAMLKRGVHHSLHLQRAYNKHGEAAFAWEVLETPQAVELAAREQALMDEHKPEYNIHLIANKPGADRKPVLQYSNEGVFIKEWSHSKPAADFLGVAFGSIKRTCQGKQVLSHGFHWRFKKGGVIEPVVEVAVVRQTHKGKKYNRVAPSEKRKPVEQLDLDGNVISTWPSMRHAAIALGVSSGSLCAGLSNKKGSYKGMKLRYANAK